MKKKEITDEFSISVEVSMLKPKDHYVRKRTAKI